jgi:cellulose synthase operon protein C
MMRRRSVRQRLGLCAALLAAALLGACSKRTPEELVAAAQRYMAQDNFRAAQIELRNAVQLAPDNGAAHRLLGTTLLRTGDPVAAERALRKALSLAEKADDVVPALALAALRQGRHKELIDEYGNATLQDPAANADLRASLGEAWLIRGEFKQAAESFAIALSARPDHARAQLGQARIAVHEDRIDDALATTDRALKSDPRMADGQFFRGQILMAKGQRAAAIESLEQALAIDASYLPARLALVSILFDGRDYDKANAVLAAAGPATKDPRINFLQGLLAFRQGDLPKAKSALAAVLQKESDHAPSLLLAGEIELRSGDLYIAEQHFGKAAQIQRTPTVQRLLATTYLRQNRPGKAVDILQPLLQEAGPKDANLMMLAGEAYLANGDVRRAAEFFEASKSAGPTEAAARKRLGQIAATRGDFDRGAAELQAASALTPDSVEPDLLLVALHLQRREPAKAVAAAQAFIGKQPKNPVGHVLIGKAYAAGKDRALARKSFEAALGLKPDHLPAARGLAELDVAEGRPADARRRLEDLVAKKPDDEQLLIALGQIQERTGQAAEAGKTLRRAITAKPTLPSPYVELARYHLRRNEPQAAIEVAQEAVRTTPDQMRMVELLAVAQEAAGASREAVRTLNALISREPHALEPLMTLARVQAKQRDFDGAAATLLRALEKAPENANVARELVGSYLAGGKSDLALGVAKRLQTERPKDAIGHVLEGDVRASGKKWPEAERAYRAAIGVDAKATIAAVRVIQVVATSGRKKEAIEFARQWSMNHPADLTVRMMVADAAMGARDHAAAKREYEIVLEQDSNNVVALNNLAWILAESNDPEALEYAERAAQLEPNNSSVLDTLGHLQLRRGDAKKAFEHLDQARKLAPERKDLRLSYAKALLQAGRVQEGKAELQTLAAAKEDFPGKADIGALLK